MNMINLLEIKKTEKFTQKEKEITSNLHADNDAQDVHEHSQYSKYRGSNVDGFVEDVFTKTVSFENPDTRKKTKQESAQYINVASNLNAGGNINSISGADTSVIASNLTGDTINITSP
jgi:hypothetical protein